MQFLRRHRAEHAHGETRPRKRVPPDELVGQSQFLAHVTHLVFKERAQRLDEREAHGFRQAAHVVVALDAGCGFRIRRAALDHVGVNRALGQEVHRRVARGLVLEHVNESLADDAPLFFRVSDVRQRF